MIIISVQQYSLNYSILILQLLLVVGFVILYIYEIYAYSDCDVHEAHFYTLAMFLLSAITSTHTHPLYPSILSVSPPPQLEISQPLFPWSLSFFPHSSAYLSFNVNYNSILTDAPLIVCSFAYAIGSFNSLHIPTLKLSC